MIHYNDYVIELIEQDILRAYNDGKVDYTERQDLLKLSKELLGRQALAHQQHGAHDGGGDGGVVLCHILSHLCTNFAGKNSFTILESREPLFLPFSRHISRPCEVR